MAKLIEIIPLVEYNEYGKGIEYDQKKQIMKLIKRGARDPDIFWANALDLVKSSYDVTNVELPLPSVTDQWDDLESLLGYAVQQLDKATADGIRDKSWKSGMGLR